MARTWRRRGPHSTILWATPCTMPCHAPIPDATCHMPHAAIRMAYAGGLAPKSKSQSAIAHRPWISSQRSRRESVQPKATNVQHGNSIAYACRTSFSFLCGCVHACMQTHTCARVRAYLKTWLIGLADERRRCPQATGRHETGHWPQAATRRCRHAPTPPGAYAAYAQACMPR